MENVHAGHGGTGGPVIGGTDPFGHPLPPVVDPPPPPPPIDPDTLHQIEMLNEAVLNVFAADLPSAKPFEVNTLQWDVTMPTTVIPGVVPVLELSVGAGGRVDGLSAHGSRPATQRSATTYELSIIAPKASRWLGSLTIDVDLSEARRFMLDAFIVTKPVTDQIKAGFPDGGGLTLRTPPVVGVHLEAVTVDLALAVEVPNFFDAEADVSISWTLSGKGPGWGDPIDADARIACAISTAHTSVDPGTLGSIFSGGCADVAAAAVERVSDGYLGQLVGPLIADDIRERLADDWDSAGNRYIAGVVAQQRPGSGWIFHHLDVTPDGLSFWYCTKPTPTSHPGTGTQPPVHPTNSGW